MDESQEQILVKQVESKPARDELGRLLPGNTANPNGRPKGQSLKEFWRQRFQEMTEDEKIAFSNKVGNDTLWKMAEGNPKQDLEHSGNLNIAQVIKKLKDGRTPRQAVEIGLPLQNPGQEEKPNSLPAEQSPSPLQLTQVVEKFNPEEPAAGIHD